MEVVQMCQLQTLDGLQNVNEGGFAEDTVDAIPFNHVVFKLNQLGL